MRHGIRRFPALWRASRLARRWYHARRNAYPDWSTAIAADQQLWKSARAAAQGGPRVLMATAIGSYAHAVTLESALAVALTFRGAEVHALLCDGTLTACAECEASLYPNLHRFVEHGPEGINGFEGRYREVSPMERAVQTFEWDGMPGHVIVNITTFEDLGDDRTRMVTISQFHTPEERDGMLNSGMEVGMEQSYQALDQLLAKGVR